MAFHLVEEGHEVHVVTGIPNYPAGKFYPGYGLFKKRHEVVRGVKVTRLPIFPRGEGSKIMLILNSFSFLVVGWIYMLFHAMSHKYDVVFCEQLSPVMMSGKCFEQYIQLYEDLISGTGSWCASQKD